MLPELGASDMGGDMASIVGAFSAGTGPNIGAFNCGILRFEGGWSCPQPCGSRGGCRLGGPGGGGGCSIGWCITPGPLW